MGHVHNLLILIVKNGGRDIFTPREQRSSAVRDRSAGMVAGGLHPRSRLRGHGAPGTACPSGTRVSRPQTDQSGSAASRCGRDARAPRMSIANVRDRPPPLDQPDVGHALRPPGAQKHTHRVPGNAGVPPASIGGGLAILFAGGTQAFPGRRAQGVREKRARRKPHRAHASAPRERRVPLGHGCPARTGAKLGRRIPLLAPSGTPAPAVAAHDRPAFPRHDYFTSTS